MPCRPALRWPAHKPIQPPLPPHCACCAQARQELRELSGQDEGRKLDDILGSVGLAGVADQLKDLRLGEYCRHVTVVGSSCFTAVIAAATAAAAGTLLLMPRLCAETAAPLSFAGELLDTPPPGVDEAIAIAKVIQFLKASGQGLVGGCVLDCVVRAPSREEGRASCCYRGAMLSAWVLPTLPPVESMHFAA